MARSERQEDGTRGGVGTMTRSGTRSRPQQVPEGAPTRVAAVSPGQFRRSGQ